MEVRNINGTELAVSVVGLGCNNFGMLADEQTSLEVINAAFDAGIDFFDTVDVYGGRGRSAEILGKAMAGRNRSELIIATKFGNPMSDDGAMKGASRDYIVAAVEASLSRLRTDYIDLYQQLFPIVRRRSKKRCGRWMTWFRLARSGQSATPISTPGSWRMQTGRQELWGPPICDRAMLL